MALMSQKEIQNRMRSMRSTRQITQAMELVSHAKLRRAQASLHSSRLYCEALCQAVHQVAGSGLEVSSPYLAAHPVKKTAWIVIAGDRGLAGAYNSNLLKTAWNEMDNEQTVIVPIGKKAIDFFRSRQCTLLSESGIQTADISASDCFSIARQLCKAYLAGEFDQLRITYTNFLSVMSQAPVTMQLLPLVRQEMPQNDILYEPDSATVLDAIIPEYVGGVLYGAICESRAAEHAARRIAMSAATDNANELIDDLSLQYNRIRQAAITQQITEIVAGSQSFTMPV